MGCNPPAEFLPLPAFPCDMCTFLCQAPRDHRPSLAKSCGCLDRTPRGWPLALRFGLSRDGVCAHGLSFESHCDFYQVAIRWQIGFVSELCLRQSPQGWQCRCRGGSWRLTSWRRKKKQETTTTCSKNELNRSFSSFATPRLRRGRRPGRSSSTRFRWWKQLRLRSP